MKFSLGFVNAHIKDEINRKLKSFKNRNGISVMKISLPMTCLVGIEASVTLDVRFSMDSLTPLYNDRSLEGRFEY
ncbi:hypothetical protein TNCT_152071 [Trichonephila clavata]|uniref:Uncharacterized protein n=1 Tax=Trichonephila clavata TaxID=2740835 RepID=A0A8X6GXU4_TRICU|nr:hypothetical protein TNCT_152071 [Trichonephila clavata]